MRLNNEERREIRLWLVEAKIAFERYQSFHCMRYIPQLPPISTRAMGEATPPSVSFYTEAIEAHILSLPGKWMQFVACDPRNDEPLIFGEPYQSDRKQKDEYERMMAWIRHDGPGGPS